MWFAGTRRCSERSKRCQRGRKRWRSDARRTSMCFIEATWTDRASFTVTTSSMCAAGGTPRRLRSTCAANGTWRALVVGSTFFLFKNNDVETHWDQKSAAMLIKTNRTSQDRRESAHRGGTRTTMRMNPK